MKEPSFLLKLIWLSWLCKVFQQYLLLLEKLLMLILQIELLMVQVEAQQQQLVTFIYLFSSIYLFLYYCLAASFGVIGLGTDTDGSIVLPSSA